jgi:FixJ family two-component response regulator
MIFDLTVPGAMGGKEAIQRIRKMGVNIPAFVSSGYADDPIIRNPAGYGFTASICKPFMRSELIEMLEKHMRGRE